VLGDATTAGKGISYLGAQVASRKRRELGQNQEAAWAGTILMTDKGRVVVCISDKKWERMKGLIAWIDKEAKSEMVDFKEL